MLSEQQKFEIFEKAPLFSHMQPEGLRAMCAITREIRCSEGQTLFREGDPGDTLYLLLSGEVALYKDSVLILRLSGAGTCFGEMALIEEGGRRSATVVCLGNTTALCISRNDFFILMSREFSVVRGMFSVLNSRIREDLELRVATIHKEVARVESMRLAREVQQSLLPDREISHPQLLSSGYCKSADVVGGDYYDYLPLSDHCLATIIVDVMGHGYHSAMLMAMTKSGIHTQAGFDPSIPGVMGALRRVAGEQNRTWLYLTCCYVIIDPLNGKLIYANAGHPPVLHYSHNMSKVVELDSQYGPLGMGVGQKDMNFVGTETSWNSGDILLLYSDGITEATSREGKLYGTKRLKEVLCECSHLEPSEIKKAALANLNDHLGDGRIEDDWTLVVLKSTTLEI